MILFWAVIETAIFILLIVYLPLLFFEIWKDTMLANATRKIRTTDIILSRITINFRNLACCFGIIIFNIHKNSQHSLLNFKYLTKISLSYSLVKITRFKRCQTHDSIKVIQLLKKSQPLFVYPFWILWESFLDSSSCNWSNQFILTCNGKH